MTRNERPIAFDRSAAAHGRFPFTPPHVSAASRQ